MRLDKGFLVLLKRNGVELSAGAPATLKGDLATFPVTEGKFDPTTGRGVVEHGGALFFKAGSRGIPLKALQLKTTQPRAVLSQKQGAGS